jgi:hypothetical protein
MRATFGNLKPDRVYIETCSKDVYNHCSYKESLGKMVILNTKYDTDFTKVAKLLCVFGPRSGTTTLTQTVCCPGFIILDLVALNYPEATLQRWRNEETS